MSNLQPTKTVLRKMLRIKRQQLSPGLKTHASQAITQQILNSFIFQQSYAVALYLPFDNEVDITGLFSVQEKQYYLPVITDTLHLFFASYTPGDALKPNRFGIQEPVSQDYFAAAELDLVCMPLVGFDPQGRRLGSGAGYYDRTFAFKKNIQSLPYLLGIAYECQKVEKLPHEEWDVNLWGVQTERQLYQSI